MANIFDSKDRDEVKRLMSWWFSDDPKIQKEVDDYCAKQDVIREEKIAQGYVIEVAGIYYTEQDILDGKVPLNGTLVNMGYRRRPGGKWVYDPNGVNIDE